VATYELVLDALGDRTRRQIVQVLRAGPVAVGQLAERIPVSRPAISQHLKVLQACQLVNYEPVGTRHLYRLDPAGLRELRAWLDDFWDGALGEFARLAADEAAIEPSSQSAEGGEP
jgi:DNA-binding transcriptional ArsR family regulator